MVVLSGLVAGMIFNTGCTATQPDPLDSLNVALDTVSRQESFAFSGKEELRLEGITVQKNDSIQGAVADSSRMYLRMSDGASLSSQSEDEGVIYTRTNGSWARESDHLSAVPGLFSRWNPLEKIEMLGSMHKTAVYNHALTDLNIKVIDVEINPDEVTAQVKQDIELWLSEPISDKRLTEFAKTQRLSEWEANRIRAELEQEIIPYVDKLRAMSDSLQVQMNYRFWIDSKQELPQRMTIDMFLRFRYQEKDNEESVHAEYEFRDFDKPVLIPQP
jgi:hypothetical protein